MASRRQPGDAVRGGVVSRRQRATASGRRTVAPGTASGDGDVHRGGVGRLRASPDLDPELDRGRGRERVGGRGG